eukprot:TRINITY_DN7432_c0_g1_i1.p1 TRINITY_DN7432_c0_g1~~TRINITY_DN7432_c0_g1_i1.p1  ORF type:complete len:784 (-),score=168.64 TRINITY_DN7432_c0_g1_i1:98-2422(-)
MEQARDTYEAIRTEIDALLGSYQAAERSATEQRLLSVLRRLEVCKEDAGGCSNATPEQPAPTKLAPANLESLLLPVIVHLQQERPSQEVPNTSNVVAFLNDDFKLLLHDRNFVSMLQHSSKSRVSHVVSVCGDTHVGKSTLIGQLLDPSCESKPDVASATQNEPTTSNVNYFDTIWNSSSQRGIRFLDFEGENGGKPPKWVLRDQLDAILSRMTLAEYQERRRAAVSSNMTRVAFVVSDVVIFVWNESFSNASYTQRVVKMVQNATERIDSAVAPSLILVYNKCGLDEPFDVAEATNTFFSNTENEGLRHFYSDVKCICIPHKEQVKKIRREGMAPYFIDGEEIFNLQIEKFKGLITEMLSKKLESRERNGILFSDFLWCIIFREVINRFESKLLMGQILASILRPQTYLVAIVMDFFLALYRYNKIYNKDHFLRCRGVAIDMLACMVSAGIRNKQNEYDRFVVTHLNSAEFQKNVCDMFDELTTHVHRLAPCEAALPQLDSAAQAIYCSQEQVCHTLFHRTSANVFVPSTSDAVLTRLGENLKYFLKLGYKPSWAGQHVFAYPKTPEQEHAEFTEKVKMYSQSLPTNFFLTCVNILQHGTALAKNKPYSNYSEQCWICLSHPPDTPLSGCKHIFCNSCVRQLCAVQDNAAGMCDYSYRIYPDRCPICNSKFVLPMVSEQSVLQMQPVAVPILDLAVQPQAMPAFLPSAFPHQLIAMSPQPVPMPPVIAFPPLPPQQQCAWLPPQSPPPLQQATVPPVTAGFPLYFAAPPEPGK